MIFEIYCTKLIDAKTVDEGVVIKFDTSWIRLWSCLKHGVNRKELLSQIVEDIVEPKSSLISGGIYESSKKINN